GIPDSDKIGRRLRADRPVYGSALPDHVGTAGASVAVFGETVEFIVRCPASGVRCQERGSMSLTPDTGHRTPDDRRCMKIHVENLTKRFGPRLVLDGI